MLKQKDGIYYVFIPELSLMAQGQTPDEAWQNLETRKIEFFRTAVDLEFQQSVREPAAIRLKENITAFLIKVVVVAVLLLVALNIIVRPYYKIIKRQTDALNQASKTSHSSTK